MRFVTGLCLALCITGAVTAQTQTISFETGYTPGAAVVGQDGWTVQTGDAGAPTFVIDNTVYSPMSGSTKSLKLGGGQTSLTRVQRTLDTPVLTGVWRVGFDFRYTGQVGTTNNLFGTLTLYDDNAPGNQQIFQPYIQDGDGGNPAGAGVNAFTCITPLSGYGANSLGFDGVHDPNVWYRLEFTMDMDQGLIMDLATYDISSGSKVLKYSNIGTFYFQSDAGTYFHDLTRIGVRWDTPASVDEAWWFDNFTISPGTLPAVHIGGTPLWANSGVPFSKQVTTSPPQTVTWTLNNGPAGAVIDANTGVISGWTPTTPGSTQDFEVTASSIRGTSDTKTFTVTVLGPYDLVIIPYDAQLDIGSGPAITPVSQWSFLPADETTTDGFGQYLLSVGFGADSWFWNPPLVDFAKAGFGGSVDMSSCYTRLTVDLRYYKENGYGDAPLSVVLYDTSGRSRGFDWYYNVNTGPLYPEWQHPTIYLNNWTMSTWQTWWISDPAFDPTQVRSMAWFGTDWGGTGNDYFDVQHLVITNEPIIPVIAQVTPDPQAAFVDTPYSKQMSVLPCSDVTWTLDSDGTGATIDANGLVGGWTPSAGQLGHAFTFTVHATGPGGTGDMTYHVLVKPTQLPDGGPDTPWGTIDANNSGTQSSDAEGMILSKDWAEGAEVDMTLSLPSANQLATRASERGSIVFDNAGNLYWKGIGNPCYLCSATPTLGWRWISNASTTPVGLGGDDTSTPVVGDGQRVYVLTDDGIAAFNKADGDLVWTTTLPDCRFAGDGDRLTPVLHGGKLYVVSSSQPDKTIYQVDSLSGVVDWSSPFSVDIDTGWGEMKGQMCLVPDALGAGVHGLYLNGDAGGSGQGMYCLAVDPSSGATLQWSDRGGKVARSHVIYVAASQRVCTVTWGDYGASIYSWNLDGSKPAATGGNPSSSGYSDFGAVDFDGNDVIGGGFDGRINRYIDVAAPGDVIPPTEVAYDSGGFEALAPGDLPGQDSWQLDNYGTPTAVPQVVDDPTGSGHGKVIMLLPDGTDGWEGAFRPFTLSGGTVSMEWDQWRADTDCYVGVADEFLWWYNWYADQTGGNIWAAYESGTPIPLVASTWQHVKYLFDAANGVVTLTVDGVSQSAMFGSSPLNAFDIQMSPPATGPLYFDNLIIKQGPGTSPAFAGTGWYQMDSMFYEPRGTGGLYKDENGKSIYIDGTSADAFSMRIVGFNLTDSVMYTDPPAGVDPGQNEPRLFEYDTGAMNNPYGGPVLGPAVAGVRQHIYFFANDSELVALTHIRPIPGDFSGDRKVDMIDLGLFLDCAAPSAGAAGPTIPVTTDCANRDLDGDNDIDQDDFGIFQRCFTGPDATGNPDCAG